MVHFGANHITNAFLAEEIRVIEFREQKSKTKKTGKKRKGGKVA